MIDARLVPANRRVAARHLEGQVTSATFVDGEVFQCCGAAADLLSQPDGPRAAQLLFGDGFNVLEFHEGFAFGQSLVDGYCGVVRQDQLGTKQEPTHWICAPSTHVYPGPDMKLRDTGTLYFGSEVKVVGASGDWSELSTGLYVPTSHSLPLRTRLNDPAAIADLFLGSPYLWGGSTRYGMDCSGLIQIAWRASGLPCPRDSDMQEEEIGTRLGADQAPQRGDLVFWRGHVGIMVSDTMLLHSNAHHMSVAYELLDEAAARIDAAGQGKITSIKRPDT